MLILNLKNKFSELTCNSYFPSEHFFFSPSNFAVVLCLRVEATTTVYIHSCLYHALVISNTYPNPFSDIKLNFAL